METIPLSECTKVGFVQKTHGVKGEVLLGFDEEFEDSVESAIVFFFKADGSLVPFFVEPGGLQIVAGNRARIKFRWIDSAEKAREFTGTEVYLKSSEIKEQSDDFTLETIIGFTILDDLKTQIGTVTEVNNYGGNIVLSIDHFGKEILVPFHPELVRMLDSEKKVVQLFIPEGLLDLENS